MTSVNIFLLKLGFFLVFVPLVGLYLSKLIDLTRDAWLTNNRKKKWIASSIIVALYLILTGFFL